MNVVEDEVRKMKKIVEGRIIENKKLFTKEELNSMKLIKYKFKEYSASELSDWSHSFKGYIDTKNGEIIDYKYAKYLDIDNI